MIDTDKYGMTNEELLERYSNLSVDDYKDLLAEVKRLREGVSSIIRCMLSESEESPSWAITVHQYIKDLQKVIE